MAPDVISVTPFLEGTLRRCDGSARFPAVALHLDRRGKDVLRHYGTLTDHDRARGLDERGIRERIARVLEG